MIQGHIDRDWKILIENILHVSVKLQIALWVKKFRAEFIFEFSCFKMESNLDFEANIEIFWYDSKLFIFHPLCNIANPTHEKKIMNLFIRKAANIEISNKETCTLFIQDYGHY